MLTAEEVQSNLRQDRCSAVRCEDDLHEHKHGPVVARVLTKE